MDICNAIAARRLVSFDYDNHQRVVQPAAAGPHATTGNPVLTLTHRGCSSSCCRLCFD